MDRNIIPFIEKDLKKKMVFLGGPRQIGKTTLAKMLLAKIKGANYYNWDSDEHRKIIRKKEWNRQEPLVVFDELHKSPGWKNWLKGVYDVEGNKPAILVTGSARLDLLKKHGDSLLGRYHYHRLHPISVKELSSTMPSHEALENIFRFGGFPEPLLSGSEIDSKRWRKERMELVIREDIVTLESIRHVGHLELLVDLLKERVGSPISIKSLSEDLHVSPHTVSSWIEILERMYLIFIVRPYSKSIARAIRKEYKIYFMDCAAVENEGARFENLIACHLLKYANFKEDTEGDSYRVCILRDKEKREVDFCLVKNNHPIMLVEAKTSAGNISPNLTYFKKKYFQKINAVQAVYSAYRVKTNRDGVALTPADQFLMELV